MRIVLIFLLIASTFAASEINDFFYDIQYNKEYEVDVNKFYPLGYIPKVNYHLTVPFENLDETINLDIRFLKADKIDLKVKVSGFSQKPTKSKILNGTHNIELEQSEIFSLDNYIYYIYSVPTLKKQAKINI